MESQAANSWWEVDLSSGTLRPSLLLSELDRKEHLKEKPGFVFQESFVGYT